MQTERAAFLELEEKYISLEEKCDQLEEDRDEEMGEGDIAADIEGEYYDPVCCLRIDCFAYVAGLKMLVEDLRVAVADKDAELKVAQDALQFSQSTLKEVHEWLSLFALLILWPCLLVIRSRKRGSCMNRTFRMRLTRSCVR